MKNNFPLCVDLDGTLIQTDLLFESFFQLIKKNLLYLIFPIYWLLQGKSVLKSRIAEQVEIDPSLLPYNKEFLSFLRKEKTDGRTLILVTASHEKFAHKIADHLKLFDTTFATKSGINLSGKEKLNLLRKTYGEKGFDYAGNSTDDLKIWPHARKAILVNPELGVESAAKNVAAIEHIFNNKQSTYHTYIKALRPHQWLKNLLIFIPLLTAHKWNEFELLLQAVLAFTSFSLCASSVYILNDLLDLPEDRQHPRKCLRPFASGALSIKAGTLLAVALLLISFSLAILGSPYFAAMLGLYYVITLAYSMYFKRIVLIDVFLLAGLYTMRIIAGAAAIKVEVSFWILAFSMFIFLSLAMVKRFGEIQDFLENDKRPVLGRGYIADDLETLSSLGVTSGYMAALVLALYINSPKVLTLYSQPQIIWFLCPILLFWISRMWLAARRGQMHDDPIIYALKDFVSRRLGVVVVLIFYGAL